MVAARHEERRRIIRVAPRRCIAPEVTDVVSTQSAHAMDLHRRDDIRVVDLLTAHVELIHDPAERRYNALMLIQNPEVGDQYSNVAQRVGTWNDRARIAERYPEATFDVAHGDGAPGAYLIPPIDIKDTEELFDLIGDRLLETHIEEGLRIYVFPVRPLARVLAELPATGSPSSSE